MFVAILILGFLNVFAEATHPTLEVLSQNRNKTLPEIYDPITKLVSTSVEHNNFFYQFVVEASKEEFKGALLKVKAQILKTICSGPLERSLLLEHKANIVYRYESHKGESLGQFMVAPEHCKKTKN